jgi:hypothetical protein
LSQGLPKIYVVFDGKMYAYPENPRHIEVFLHFINRILEPLVTLTATNEVVEFFDADT